VLILDFLSDFAEVLGDLSSQNLLLTLLDNFKEKRLTAKITEKGRQVREGLESANLGLYLAAICLTFDSLVQHNLELSIPRRLRLSVHFFWLGIALVSLRGSNAI
jgi:hypothetical protein